MVVPMAKDSFVSSRVIPTLTEGMNSLKMHEFLSGTDNEIDLFFAEDIEEQGASCGITNTLEQFSSFFSVSFTGLSSPLDF